MARRRTWPLSVRWHAPVRRSHIFTVESDDPDASAQFQNCRHVTAGAVAVGAARPVAVGPPMFAADRRRRGGGARRRSRPAHGTHGVPSERGSICPWRGPTAEACGRPSPRRRSAIRPAAPRRRGCGRRASPPWRRSPPATRGPRRRRRPREHERAVDVERARAAAVRGERARSGRERCQRPHGAVGRGGADEPLRRVDRARKRAAPEFCSVRRHTGCNTAAAPRAAARRVGQRRVVARDDGDAAVGGERAPRRLAADLAHRLLELPDVCEIKRSFWSRAPSCSRACACTRAWRPRRPRSLFRLRRRRFGCCSSVCASGPSSRAAPSPRLIRERSHSRSARSVTRVTRCS